MKTIKHVFALFVILNLPVLVLHGQNRTGQNNENEEKFRSMKIAFFSERIGLTPEEAEKFWPVYNDYEKKKADLNAERRDKFRNYGTRIEQMTDAQVEELIDQNIEFQKRDTQLDVDFHAEIKKVLPPKKVMKLYLAETQFREYMLRQLRGDRDSQRNNRY